MKKTLIITLCAVMAISLSLLAACGGGSSDSDTSTDAGTEAPAAEEETPATTDEETPATTEEEAPAETASDASGAVSYGSGYTIPTIVKLIGIGWFDRMEEGIKEFGEQTGNTTLLLGPPQADAALQNQIIEDQIAQNVDAISVVPFSPEACEPVLKKAMEKGIVVIGHEADNLINCDYDIEAFNNFEYGAELMKLLGEATGGKGKYITSVGSVTSKSQNQWEEGGVEYQKANLPDMELVEQKLETHDEQKKAQEIMVEMLKKYPDLKGFQGATSQDAPGAAQAVEDAGLTGKVFVVGTSMPSIAGKYLENGSLYAMMCWDPAQAGKAMDGLAVLCLDGKRDEIKEGLNLGYKGYENIKLNAQTEVKDNPEKYLEGNALIKITSVEEMEQYPF
jgi:simple sugar transport system substrate-binding protein